VDGGSAHTLGPCHCQEEIHGTCLVVPHGRRQVAPPSDSSLLLDRRSLRPGR
jgi:hypothetical protein